MPATTISGSLDEGITLGAGGIGTIVSVTGTGDIYPSPGFQYVYVGATLLQLSDTLINAGTVQGSGPDAFRGGVAAAGVVLNAGTVINSGTLLGGYGFDQGGPHGSFYLGQGGNGVAIASGKLTNTGLIQGGGCGNGNSPDGFPEFFGNPVAGAGGIGVVLASGTVGNVGTIRGGGGGGAAFGANDVPTLYANGTGGAGGDGVAMSGGVFTNTGLIQAGTGGSDIDPPGTSYFGGAGGVGGFGLALSGGVFTNIGAINGGAGGAANVASSTYLPSYIGSGGSGGAGVYLNGGVLFDAGRISGGVGGAGTYGGKTSNGASGDAVLFGGAAGTLVVESGAAFSGQVVANAAAADVLELSGSSASALAGIGTEFLNFNHISFAAGAAWAIAGNIGGLASGETISGFAPGDAIILDGYVANSESFVSGTGLELNGGAETLRINPPADGVFAVTTNGGNSTITAFLETLSTTLTPGITLDTAPFSNILTITSSGAIYGSPGFFTSGDGVQNAFPGPVPSNDILVNAGKIVGFSGSQFSRYPAGLGVFLPGSGSITNTGTIIGGAGAAGNGDNDHGFSGNPGATGVYLTNGVLTNSGLIKGGNGGIGDGGNYGGAGGNGGVGVYLALGTMANTGIIQGGNGGAAEGGQYGGANGGNGGAGIYLADATLIDAGTIGGGAGGAGAPFDSSEGGSLTITGSSGVEGDAVQFRGGAGTLVVESGAVFNGLVVADAGVADVLELAGSSATELSGIGTEFLNFDNISFAPGAAWRIEGDEAGLAAGQTIGGFAAGDSIILDGYAATHDSFIPGLGLVLSNGGTTVTLDITGALTTADFAVTGADGQTTITYVPPRIISGGVVSSGETLTLAAGEVGSAIVVDGGTEYVTSGGLAIGTIIESGGHETIFSSGTASRTVISNGGNQYVGPGGIAVGAIVSSGGKEWVNSGGAALAATVYSGGEQTVIAGGSASHTVVSSGAHEIVYGTASGAVISNGGVEWVYSGGLAVGTEVLSGGRDNVSAGGRTSATSVGNGGVEYVSAGAIAAFTQIASGGRQTLFSGGDARGTIIEAGGNQYVGFGASAIGAIVSGGREIVSSGGTASGTVISNGGTEILVNGAIATGGFTFAGNAATLSIAATILPSNVISGFDATGATGDEIILTGFTYASADSATLGADNVLTLNLNGATKTLNLDPAQNFAGHAFALQPNSQNQVVITDPDVGAANAALFTEILAPTAFAASFAPAAFTAPLSADPPPSYAAGQASQSLQQGAQFPAAIHSGFTTS